MGQIRLRISVQHSDLAKYVCRSRLNAAMRFSDWCRLIWTFLTSILAIVITGIPNHQGSVLI